MEIGSQGVEYFLGRVSWKEGWQKIHPEMKKKYKQKGRSVEHCVPVNLTALQLDEPQPNLRELVEMHRSVHARCGAGD